MEKEVVFGDKLTAQEHEVIGSTPEYNPTKEDQWYIPNGVLRGTITIEEAINARTEMKFVAGNAVASLLGFYDKSVAISLEPIDPTTHQTIGDPEILGTLDPKTKEIIAAKDKVTGEIRDLTSEYINLFRERGLEEKLHLRPQSLGEKETISGSETMKDN